MNHLRNGAAAVIAAAALSTGGVTVASAASHAPTHTPCSSQQAQLTRAQAKLDSLTAKFAAARSEVKQDRKAVAATKGSAKAQAKKALRADQAKKVRTAKAKKAQLQRVAHATARLNNCQAANTSGTTAGA